MYDSSRRCISPESSSPIGAPPPPTLPPPPPPPRHGLQAPPPRETQRRQEHRLRRLVPLRHLHPLPFRRHPLHPLPRHLDQLPRRPRRVRPLLPGFGLSGPEDFAIPAAAWEASKARSSLDLLPVSPSKAEVRDDRFPVPPRVSIAAEVTPKPAGGRCGGIKGNRPTVLAPPPSMSLPVLGRDCSTWELVRSFAPDSGYPLLCGRRRRSKKLWMKTRPRRRMGYLVGWGRPRRWSAHVRDISARKIPAND